MQKIETTDPAKIKIHCMPFLIADHKGKKLGKKSSAQSRKLQLNCVHSHREAKAQM